MINKIAHLREASFIEHDNIVAHKVLSSMLFEAKLGYSTPHSPFKYSGGLECLVISHTKDNENQFLHIVTFEEGAGAAVINTLQQKQNNVDEAEPPEDNEFIRSQLFLICSDNHVGWVSHNHSLRQGSVLSIIMSLLLKFHPSQPVPRLLLTAPVNQEAFNTLSKEGIKSIELKTTAFPQQLEYAKNGGQVPATISALIHRHNISADDIEASHNLKQKIILTTGRFWEVPNVKVILEKITAELMNDDDSDDFVIRTKKGHTLTKEKMTISGEFLTHGNSQTLDKDETFQALKSVFRDMIRAADE